MDHFSGPWVILAAAVLAYGSYSVVSRIFFHSLRGFPGPKLASVTWWYTAYYEMIQDGGLVEQLERLHEIYGPIVRIAPDELHFSDPRAYAGIYNIGSKFTKDPKFYQAFRVAEGYSSFTCHDPREAKIRRDAVSPLFSRRAILKLENVVQGKVDMLLSALLQCESLGHSANMDLAFHSTTVDLITSYCFGHSYGALAAPNFQHPIVLDVISSQHLLWCFKYFPFTKHTVLRLSGWFGNQLGIGFVDMRKKLLSQIDDILADPASLQTAEHETIFDHLITSLPGKEGQQMIPKHSLLNEAKTLMFAGTGTVANTCKIGSFYVLSDKTVHTRLVKELDEVWPDKESKIGLETLERLPYLTAVIKESLRMGHGLVNGPPRIVGPNSAEIGGVSVPKGTIVSMGATFVHNNAEIFPDPFKFSPERWLQPNSNKLDPYLVAFSRGPRSCYGINLAWCELYLIFGNLFRMMDMTIDQTTLEDLKFRGYFLPVYRGRPLRVFIKERQI